MTLTTTADLSKKDIFEEVKKYLAENNFNIQKSDDTRPWGGFYVIDESQSEQFINFFFPEVPEATYQPSQKISPKILIVESGKRLSWQYHERRSEVWKVIGGETGVIQNDTDEQTTVQNKMKGDVIILKQGERHRIVGQTQWGILAEIWQHTDVNKPSNEEDIIRVEDDFGR